MPECNGCEYIARIETLEKSADRNSEQHERIYTRLTALETQGGATNKQFEQIMDTLSELKSEVKEIKDKPSKRWKTLINSPLQWIVVAVLGAVVILK